MEGVFMTTYVLLELDLTNAPSGNIIRLSNAPYDVIWNGYVFTGNGDLLSIDGLDTTADLATIGTTVNLQGVDPAFQQQIDTNGFLNAPIDILLTDVPEGTNIASSASYWHRGYCDTPATVVDYSNNTITIGVETQSIFKQLEQVPNLMRTSQANHQAHHNGDRIYEFVASTATEEIWRT